MLEDMQFQTADIRVTANRRINRAADNRELNRVAENRVPNRGITIFSSFLEKQMRKGGLFGKSGGWIGYSQKFVLFSGKNQLKMQKKHAWQVGTNGRY